MRCNEKACYTWKRVLMEHRCEESLRASSGQVGERQDLETHLRCTAFSFNKIRKCKKFVQWLRQEHVCFVDILIERKNSFSSWRKEGDVTIMAEWWALSRPESVAELSGLIGLSGGAVMSRLWLSLSFSVDDQSRCFIRRRRSEEPERPALIWSDSHGRKCSDHQPSLGCVFNYIWQGGHSKSLWRFPVPRPFPSDLFLFSPLL